MPKYCGKLIFTHGRFPEVEKKEKRGGKKRERLNDGNNNGQATHGARKHAWCTQAVWVKSVICLYLNISVVQGQLNTNVTSRSIFYK